MKRCAKTAHLAKRVRMLLTACGCPATSFGMPTLLSGPSRRPSAGGLAKQLVIMLHGYGADGADLIGLASFFAPSLPHAEFVAPNAPEPGEMGFGYQW